MDKNNNPFEALKASLMEGMTEQLVETAINELIRQIQSGQTLTNGSKHLKTVMERRPGKFGAYLAVGDVHTPEGQILGQLQLCLTNIEADHLKQNTIVLRANCGKIISPNLPAGSPAPMTVEAEDEELNKAVEEIKNRKKSSKENKKD